MSINHNFVLFVFFMQGIGLALTFITTFLWALSSCFESRKPLEKVILNQIIHEKEAHLIAELEKIAKEKAEIDNTEEVKIIQHLVRNIVEVNGVSVPFHEALLRQHEALEKDADLKDKINNIAKQRVAHSNDEIIKAMGIVREHQTTTEQEPIGTG